MNRLRITVRLAVILGGLLALPAVSAANQGQAPKVEMVDVANAATLGAEDAPATLVIFADLGAVTARGLGVILHGLTERYPAALKVYFLHAPAADQPEHLLTHRAAIAAGAQGKFWEMLDLLVANHDQQGSDHLPAMAAQLALDPTRFSEDLDSVSAHQRLDEDRRQARSLNVAATPTFFVNGVRLTGPRSLAELSAQIDAAIAASRGLNLGR